MDYALLPFPTYTRERDYAGRPDLRAALASGERSVSAGSISNLELLDHLVEVLRDLSWKIMVDHCHEQEGSLHVAVLATDLGRSLEKGDEVNAGFFLQNSEAGRFDTLACARVFRVACWNGMLLECDEGQSFCVAAGGDRPGAWREKIKEVVDRSFCGDGIDVDAARFSAATQQIVMTPYEFLCNLYAQGLITDDEQHSIQRAFDEAADFSMYGVINAVTQAAHGLRANDRWARAFQIERLGGEILRGDHNLPAQDPVFSR